MGPVNLDAVHEYDELDERYKFLEAQNNDLTNSRRELLDVIAQINSTTRKLFAETFAQVRINFREMFAELFGGGRADLSLLDENDPLNCGIEITAKPPGKQLQSVSLLSGGERAMTAVALLFAIYMVRPSPFCILDEVDAPLDEGNINRFIGVLERFVKQSQFIIMTHNKRTIAKADVLYGVTMEERGVSRLVGMKLTAPQQVSAGIASNGRHKHRDNDVSRLRRGSARLLLVAAASSRASPSNSSKRQRDATAPQQDRQCPKKLCARLPILAKIVRCFRRRSAAHDQKRKRRASASLGEAAADKTATPHERFLEAFRWMLLTRTLEEKLVSLYRGGLITGGVYIGKGQEAVSVACGLFLEKGDIFAPLIRDQAGRSAFGEPLIDVTRTYLGSRLGPMRGRDGIFIGASARESARHGQSSRRDDFGHSGRIDGETI